MKKILLAFVCVLFITPFINAQTAEFLFVNNNEGAGATSLDVEVRVMPQDTVYTSYSGVDFLSASSLITVPANTILKINYREAGTSTIYFAQNNIVFNPGDTRISFLYGTATSKALTLFGILQNVAAGKVRYNFRHSTPTMQEIDLIVRETSTTLADNFAYSDFVSGINELTATDYILDVTPFDDNLNGLFAYEFPGTTLGGEYVFLFTSGTGSANDMYMVQLTGVVTKLNSVSPIVGTGTAIIEDKEAVTVYPNPAYDVVKIGTKKYAEPFLVSIFDMNGKLIMSKQSDVLDVSNLANGVYSLQIELGNSVYTENLIIAK